MVTKKKKTKTKTKRVTGKRASRIVLDENLDIAGVTALYDKLVKCAAKETNVNLNAARVETTDSSTLQLLLSFIWQVRENGYCVNWQKPSEALLKTVALTGLTDNLGLAEVVG